jgi:N-acetylneuraminic acid mutarotase
MSWAGGDYIFTLKGGGTPDFYRYSISQNSWLKLKPAPVEITEGADLTYGSKNSLYALRGGILVPKRGGFVSWVKWHEKLAKSKEKGTSDFYRYSISKNKWVKRAKLPGTVGAGGSLVWSGGDFIYALRGGGTSDFYRYSISKNKWVKRAKLPGTVGAGGSLVWSGGDFIYALRGGGTSDFYRYSISTNSWSKLASLPVKVDKGGALVRAGNYIYALSGSGLKQFYAYKVSDNHWIRLADLPQPAQQGTELAFAGLYIYVFPGGFATSLFRYNPFADPIAIAYNLTPPSPHGNYVASAKLCQNCHSFNGSANLTPAENIPDLCDFCHDGTGASRIFDSSKGPPGHPVAFNNISSHNENWQKLDFTCGDCHSIHGNEILSGWYFSKILKVDPDGDGVPIAPTKNSYSKLTLFCAQCHKKNHGNARTRTHPTYGYPKPDKPGVGPTCIQCHGSSGGTHKTLTKPPSDVVYTESDTDAACIRCHTADPEGAYGDCLDCHNESWMERNTTFSKAEIARMDIKSKIDKKSRHPIGCLACHKSSWRKHRNGIIEHYNSEDKNGYKFVANLRVPLPASVYKSSDLQLCYLCHSEQKLLGSPSGYRKPPIVSQYKLTIGFNKFIKRIGTNFRVEKPGLYNSYYYPVNLHWVHVALLGSKTIAWDSNGNGSVDSRASCISCHDAHGTSSANLIKSQINLSYGRDENGDYAVANSNSFALFSGPNDELFCTPCHFSQNLKYYRRFLIAP